RRGRAGDLRARATAAPAGGDDAAGIPAAGNRRARPARRGYPRPAQRAGAAGARARSGRAAARPGAGGGRAPHLGPRRAPVRPALLTRRAAQPARGLSSISSALPAAANANAPVMWVAAPSPVPQSSLSAASGPTAGRIPHTEPSACGYFTFSSEYTAGTPK